MSGIILGIGYFFLAGLILFGVEVDPLLTDWLALTACGCFLIWFGATRGEKE